MLMNKAAVPTYGEIQRKSPHCTALCMKGVERLPKRACPTKHGLATSQPKSLSL